MFVESRALASLQGGRRASGVALVVTLSLLVLVAVAVIAFFGRTATNQQITSSSANGVTAEVYATGTTEAIIASLQQEMVAGSLAAPAPTPVPSTDGKPYIMPLTNPNAVEPSRSLRSDSTISNLSAGTDPNALYFQFANLVKQSAYNVNTYSIPPAPGTVGRSASGTAIASDVKTTTANPSGRSYDGTFWNQPRLVSVPSTGTNGTTDLEPLVPYWVYTDRMGAPVLPGDLTGRIVSGNTLNIKNVVGRYAYNVYNIGGTLDANAVASGLAQNTAPVYSTAINSAVTEIVPGYKGSALAADLSGLTLNSTLKIGNSVVASPADWQQLPKWRAAGNWNTNSTNYNGFAYVLAGGQFSGWLNNFFQPFDPILGKLNTTANYLTNNRFTSRQDLINWANAYWNPTHDTTGTATWMLPYLTHFSYDTDAPTFAPDPARPKVVSGENDAFGFDDAVNPPFVGSLPSGGSGLLDANGNPLIKRRFPLSALALIANYGPGNPPPSDTALAAQIRYDFGLVWNTTLADPQTGENSPGWEYRDVDGTINRVLKLSEIASGRSPNFFELLKAAINVGSIGKQFGNVYDTNDTANAVSTTSRFGTTANQIIQIGANIISQASTNYTPTHIRFNTNTDIYGVQDFPYLYRSREIPYLLEQFTGTAMAVTTPSPATVGANQLPVTSSSLAARVVQTELWNPHAPNQISSVSTTGYPKYFRVVPTQFNASYSSSGVGNNSWKQATQGITALGSLTYDYSPAGGPICYPGVSYPPLAQTAPSHQNYLTLTPGASNTLASFREPCALIASNVPSNSADGTAVAVTATGPKTSSIATFSEGIATSSVDLSLYTAPVGTNNGIPTVFNAFSSGAGKTVFGFNMGYFCAGPYGGGSGSNKCLPVDKQTGANMSLSLQYSFDGHTYYTYDVAGSAAPSKEHLNTFNSTSGTTAAAEFQFEQGVRMDPRTHRWGFLWTQAHNYAWNDYTKFQYQGETGNSTYIGNGINKNSNSASSGSYSTLSSWHGTYVNSSASNSPTIGYSQVNQASLSSGTIPVQQRGSNNAAATSTTYYQDPDGIVRLADGAYTNYSATGIGTNITATASTIGLPMLMRNTSISGSTVVGPITSGWDSRPVMLNRPFQSVGELGYVFRDTPWRSLDFFTPQSGDNALLDVFTAYGPDPWSYATSNPANTAATFLNEQGLVTGRVDLNTAQAPVLAAMIQGTLVNTPNTSQKMIDTTSNVASQVAQALVAWTHKQNSVEQGPLRNRAELVGKYVPSESGSTPTYSGFSFGDPTISAAQLSNLLAPLGAEAPIVKQQRECIVRALADTGTTRTWNLLIDLDAQTGRLANNAAGLKDFVITGEKHQWVSVAIDRITGKIIKMQTEQVRN